MHGSEGEPLGCMILSTGSTNAAVSTNTQAQHRHIAFQRTRQSSGSSAADDSTQPDCQQKYEPHSASTTVAWGRLHLPQLVLNALHIFSSWIRGCQTSGRSQHLLPLNRPPAFTSMNPTAAAGHAAGAAAAGPVLTVRAVAAGLLVGAVLCFSNTYFGLQTGWVTMGSLQSAILGYGLFQGLGAAGLLSRHLNAAENVIVQTTAVATATMPLAAGLVGIIPALGLLTPEEHPAGPVTFTPWQLLAWCSALAFFGVFVAVPLRYQTIIREKLRFPSGTATASVIRTLHGLPPQQQEDEQQQQQQQQQQEGDREVTGVTEWGGASDRSLTSLGAGHTGSFRATAAAGDGSGVKQWRSSDTEAGGPGQQQQQQQAGGRAGMSQVDLEVAVWEAEQEQALLLGSQSAAGQSHAAGSSAMLRQQHQQQQWGRALQLLLWSFAVSGAYSLAAAWIKPLKVLKVFDWVNLPAATAWGWVLQPSAGYIGQGMIMGPKTAWNMMAGAVTGWAVLGPMAKHKGWAPGPIKDIETGAAGWLMWLGLALLLGDCFSELALLVGNTLYEKAVLNGWLSSSSSSRDTSGSGSGGVFGRGQAKATRQGSNRGGGSFRQLLAESSGFQQQQQQWGSGLRSRSGSTPKLSVAGSSLELSPNNSSGDVAESGFAGSAEQQQQQDMRGADSVAVPIGHHEFEGSSQQQGYDAQSANGSILQQDARAAGAYKAPSAAAAAAAAAYAADDTGSDAQAWLLSTAFWVPGLLLSTGLATAVLSPMLGMPWYEPLIAVLVALLVALLAVRALGQTDLNPVSGVGKISQLVFAVVSPGAVLPNLVAGAIAEAGAQQAGDLMQDFKTAHLLGVAPSAQLVAMLLGSAASVPLSVAAYMLYTSAWQVPGPELPAPTAQIWLDMAKLVNGGHLPDHIGPFCAAAAAIAAALPVLQLLLKRLQKSAARRGARSSGRKAAARIQYHAAGMSLNSDKHRAGSVLEQAAARLWDSWRDRTAVDWVLALLPSGVGFAVGCYLTPNWTLPRLIGSVIEQSWLLLSPGSHAAFMTVTASGLVLGEGCASAVTAVVQALVK